MIVNFTSGLEATLSGLACCQSGPNCANSQVLQGVPFSSPGVDVVRDHDFSLGGSRADRDCRRRWSFHGTCTGLQGWAGAVDAAGLDGLDAEDPRGLGTGSSRETGGAGVVPTTPRAVRMTVIPATPRGSRGLGSQSHHGEDSGQETSMFIQKHDNWRIKQRRKVKRKRKKRSDKECKKKGRTTKDWNASQKLPNKQQHVKHGGQWPG